MNALKELHELELLGYLGQVKKVIASNYLDDEHWAAVDSDGCIWAKGRKEPIKVIAWSLTHLAELHARNQQLEKEIHHLRSLL